MNLYEFCLPQGDKYDVPRRDGDLFWITRKNNKEPAALLFSFAAILLFAAMLASLDPPGRRHFSSVEILLMATPILIPLLLGRIYFLIRNVYAGMLDIKNQRIYKVHWITGKPKESYPSDELNLVIVTTFDEEPDECKSKGVWIYACAPEPNVDTDFVVTLWDISSREKEPIKKCVDALTQAFSWKCICGNAHDQL